MKIAMLGQKGVPATIGGVERHVEELSAHLVARGHEVTVFSRAHYVKENGLYRGVEIKRLPSIHTKHLDAATHVALSTWAALSEDFDIIHYHAIGPSLFSWIPAFWRRGVVATIHALDWQRQKWGRAARAILKLGERAALRFPHETIVVSSLLRDHFQTRYGIRTTYLPNGVSPPTPMPLNRLKRFGLLAGEYVLYLGRFVPEKGCHYLIDAFRGMKTDKKLLMAGDAPSEGGYLNSLRRRAGGDPRIIFCGPLLGEEKAEAFSNAALFVLPSEVEGMPIALLEAMSYSLPCLVSDIPENRAILGEGEEARGLTFCSRDVADLRRRLVELLTAPEIVRERCERARDHVLSQFGWPRIAERTEEVYERALARRSRARR